MVNHDSLSSSKRRAPSGPKPDVPRPRPLRNRGVQHPIEDVKIGKVVKAEELSNLVVNDLIKEALAADVRIVPDVPAADETADEMEDDVLSLSGHSETEEELESVDLASRIAHRVVQQGIKLDVAKAVEDASQEISVKDFEEEESLDDEMAARLEARQTLIQAAQNGSLLEALRDATAKKAEAENVDAKQAEVESLRREARDTLLAAARDGRLASAFKQVKEADKVETLRQEARDALLKASADGRLSAALLQSKAEKSQSVVPSTEDNQVVEPSLEEARDKARAALLNTLQTGDFQKAMAEIAEKRQVSKQSQPTPASEVPISDITSIQWHQPLQESPRVHKMPRMKRRIIGGVVRAPSESLPVDPTPPTASTSQLAWIAGPVSNGLRKKEVATFKLDDGSDTENRGLTRKSSITTMFEALGSAQLIRMDADDEPMQPAPSMRLSSSCSNLKPQGGSSSAMALDLGLDLGVKDRIGTPSMGSRCSSVGSLRALKANKAKPLPFLQKPSSKGDWSIGNAVHVMNKTQKEWSTMGTMAAF